MPRIGKSAIWRICLITCAVLLTRVAAAHEGHMHSDGEETPLLNALLYKDLPTFGTRKIVVYEQHFFSKGTDQDGILPSDESIKSAVANAMEQRNAAQSAGMEVADTVALFVTRWPTWPFATLDEHRISMTKYADVAERFALESGMKVCFYGIFPNASIAVSTRVQREEKLAQEREGAMEITVEILGDKIDAICPLLYTYYDGDTDDARRKAIDQWRLFASDTLDNIDRYIPTKPVHAFVWPQFHSGGGIKGQPDLPVEYWQAELDLLTGSVDAIVLWGGFDLAEGKQQPWDPDSDWWQVVKQTFPGATKP